jgi:putative membrane protein
MAAGDREGDPRVYMAAERTFLAWIRTAVALMAFGFFVARFGAFLHGAAIGSRVAAERDSGLLLFIGLGLIGIGVLVCGVSAIRHGRYVRAIDEGRFRHAFGSAFAYGVVALLALVGIGMAVALMKL